jgi:hypothetical protein
MTNPNETPDDQNVDQDGAIEAQRDEAETLKIEALQDGVKDIEREARIEKLDAGDDLVNEVDHDNSQKAVRADRDDRREKYKSAKVEKAWFDKTGRTQRRILQQKNGSYRPEADDPVSHGRPRVIVEGSLFDLHPLARVRKLDVKATGTIRAAIPSAPLPVRPISPGPAEEPIPGRCLECYTPLRKRDRAGTKFCTDNMGECRKAYNSREADRAILDRRFKDYQISKQADRVLSIHRVAADAMRHSAARCGIKDASFVSTDEGVLAVHAVPLPPIEPEVWVQLESGDGFTSHRVEIVATDADEGTLYTFGIFSNWVGMAPALAETPCQPEGFAIDIGLGFEGDPGEVPPTPAPPPMSAMFAALNGRVDEFLMARAKDLAA